MGASTAATSAAEKGSAPAQSSNSDKVWYALAMPFPRLPLERKGPRQKAGLIQLGKSTSERQGSVWRGDRATCTGTLVARAAAFPAVVLSVYVFLARAYKMDFVDTTGFTHIRTWPMLPVFEVLGFTLGNEFENRAEAVDLVTTDQSPPGTYTFPRKISISMGNAHRFISELSKSPCQNHPRCNGRL